jgi:hypothetical protein
MRFMNTVSCATSGFNVKLPSRKKKKCKKKKKKKQLRRNLTHYSIAPSDYRICLSCGDAKAASCWAMGCSNAMAEAFDDII